MIKKPTKETLADKIAGVLNTAPVSFDPEDEDLDNTRAQLVNVDLDENYDDEQLLSEFRKKNIVLLEDVDPRYVGKKVSRKEWAQSDEESSDGDEASYEEGSDTFSAKHTENESNDEERDENEESDSEGKTNEISDLSEEEGADEGSEEEDGFSDAQVESENYTAVREDDDFKTVSKTDVSAEERKGLCVRNQITMWENLLEMRIQLQKCLITANKMPQKQAFTEIKKHSGQEFSNQVAITKNSLANVLDKLLLLQELVLKKYPETKNLHKNQQKDASESGNEEIASDTDDEKSAEAVEEEESECVSKKKRKINEFEKELGDGHNKYRNYRNTIIQKWNEKTRFSVMKNNPNTHSVIDQIEHTLSDKRKLRKRTQLKRSEYIILGQKPEPEESKDQQNEESHTGRPTEEYNSEIFDDDDFYHQLLRELIEVKSADITDPVQLSRQWIQLQNLRSKMKRKIDTRATKGRKVRYVVHPKLVNFMAPIDESLWSDEAKSELFSSLFGKKDRINSV